MPTTDSAQFIGVDGTSIRYLECGDGPALLLLHGGVPGLCPFVPAAELWAPLVKRLAASHRVIAVDLPGTGGTGCNDVADLTVAGGTSRIVQLIEALGLSEVHLVAHGESALHGLALTRRLEGVVLSCVLMSATGPAPRQQDEGSVTLAYPPRPRWSRGSQRWALERLSVRREHIDDPILDQLVAFAQAKPHRYSVSATDDPEVRARLIVDQLAARTVALAAAKREPINVPIGVVWGSDDPLASLDQAHVLVATLDRTAPHVGFYVLGGVGHLPHREDPDRAARVVATVARAATERTC